MKTIDELLKVKREYKGEYKNKTRRDHFLRQTRNKNRKKYGYSV